MLLKVSTGYELLLAPFQLHFSTSRCISSVWIYFVDSLAFEITETELEIIEHWKIITMKSIKREREKEREREREREREEKCWLLTPDYYCPAFSSAISPACLFVWWLIVRRLEIMVQCIRFRRWKNIPSDSFSFFFFLFSFFFTGNVWKVASKQFRTSQKNPNDNAASAPRSPCDSAVIKRFVNDKCQNSNTLKEFESWNESTSLKNIPARSETATTGADSFT